MGIGPMMGQLKGKWVKIPRGPAAVKEEFFLSCHWETGKVRRTMILKPEDLPVWKHHMLYGR